jgi:surface polysaccharide O-acyltransferase-like enzyme
MEDGVANLMKRNYAIDYIKFYAIFAVLLIHAGPFEETSLLGIDGYYIDFAIDTLSRFSVPFFFISSGYLFGKKITSNRDMSIYFSKYTSKLVKIFVCWFTFYFLYDLVVKILFQSFNILSMSEILAYVKESIHLEVFFYGESSGYQLWYLAALVWSIVILFIFANINRLNLLLLISLILHLAGLFGQSYSGLISLPFDTRDGIFFGLFYTTLGAYISNHQEVIERFLLKVNPKSFITMLVVSSFLLLAERSITVFLFEGEIGDYFIFTLPITLSLFLLALYKPELGKGSLFTKIGAESVGIYVIHVFFIKVIKLIVDINQFSWVYETFIWNLIFTPLVLVLSYTSYSALQKLKRIIGLLENSESNLQIGNSRKNYNCK